MWSVGFKTMITQVSGCHYKDYQQVLKTEKTNKHLPWTRSSMTQVGDMLPDASVAVYLTL